MIYSCKHSGETYYYKAVKGAVHACVNIAKNLKDPKIKQKIDEKEEEFANNGFKSLGIMISDGCKTRDNIDNVTTFNFCGIITLSDPAREDSKSTVERAQKLGVAVKMITGDTKPIAKYILKEIGLKPNVIFGKDFTEKADSGSEQTSEQQK
jgi:H+-transporting ATPase